MLYIAVVGSNDFNLKFDLYFPSFEMKIKQRKIQVEIILTLIHFNLQHSHLPRKLAMFGLSLMEKCPLDFKVLLKIKIKVSLTDVYMSISDIIIC